MSKLLSFDWMCECACLFVFISTCMYYVCIYACMCMCMCRPRPSVSETLEFQSKLYEMPYSDFVTRRSFLAKFLNLPDLTRKVKDLAGGQQRRLSLAVALVHQHRLLILDEPTVGVDPLLRARIWRHLTELADDGVSIIITTHYVEEARMAHRVGMMRAGKLLAEGYVWLMKQDPKL
jgi:ABC-type multidrug transport system ATPase subunit